jgi:hypothetical protein
MKHRSVLAAALVALLWACLGGAGPAAALDCSQGYLQGNGGYYKADDRTGPYYVGSNGTTCTAVPISGAVNANGSAAQPVDTVVQGAAVYRGGTITAGGTSQQLMAANSARRGFTVQNQSTTDLYVKVGQTATTNNVSLRLSPGQFYETQPQHASTSVVNIIGATTGQAFYATEF